MAVFCVVLPLMFHFSLKNAKEEHVSKVEEWRTSYVEHLKSKLPQIILPYFRAQIESCKEQGFVYCFPIELNAAVEADWGSVTDSSGLTAQLEVCTVQYLFCIEIMLFIDKFIKFFCM